MTVYVGAETTSYPYSGVVYVESTFSNGMKYIGTGFMVGPNDVLTASHVIYRVNDGGVATSVTVSPAHDGGSNPFGSYEALWVNYYATDLDGDGRSTRAESQDDFAVLGLDTRLGDTTGTFTFNPYATTGTYHLTGYPSVYRDASGYRMTDDVGTATEDRWSTVFNLTSIESNPGNSGGPLWYEAGGEYYAVGLLSTGGWAADVASHYGTILGWISGNDYLINATSGADALTGTGLADKIYGLSGNDTVSGAAGNDILYGNKGLDQLYGGVGNDTLFGGQNAGSESGSPLALRDGVEFLFGGAGDDVLYGNHGDDVLSGGNGADALFGGQNEDTLRGGAGNDVLHGNRDNDVLSGGAGNDSLIGNAGNDVIYGGDGDDIATFSGNFSHYNISVSADFIFVIDNRTGAPDGTDQLFQVETLNFADRDSTVSSLGDDTVTSGDGDDTYTGTDTNVVVNGSIGSPATATIENFIDGSDKIVLTGFGFTSAGSPSISIRDDGAFGSDGGMVLEQDNDNNKVILYVNGVGSEDYAKITVIGVTTLDLNDFEFA